MLVLQKKNNYYQKTKSLFTKLLLHIHAAGEIVRNVNKCGKEIQEKKGARQRSRVLEVEDIADSTQMFKRYRKEEK